MPYNTSAIPRPEATTGTSALPLARVKKIIAQDDDIAQCSNSAAFAISIATEEFLRYLTEQAYNVAKSESKPRKNIQYKDIAAAVAKLDNLQFLSDTVPRTVPYKQVKEKDKEKAQIAAAAARPLEAEDAEALNGHSANQRSISQMMKSNQMLLPVDNESHNPDEPTSPSNKRISLSMANSPIVDRTVQPPRTNGHRHTGSASDVDMAG